MRRLLPTAVVVLLLAGTALAADRRHAERRLSDLDEQELAQTETRLEQRLLEVQRRRFEARNRGDADDVARTSRKFTHVSANLRNVLAETHRRGER